MIHIKDLRTGVNVFKALSSDIRIEILDLLAAEQSYNLNDLANKLNLSNSAITMHIKKLEESGLIEVHTDVGKHGLQKICYLNEEKLLVELRGRDIHNVYEVEIKVGHFSNYHAQPTCGLATKHKIIGDFDDPRYFADPQRIDADIIWMTEGFLEYRIPNYLKASQKFNELQFLLELGSEAPGFCNTWLSDIHFYLNDFELGSWNSPGDFGDVRGRFNPDWWPPHLNQYGMLKLIRINGEGSFIDGCRISDLTLTDIGLNYKSNIAFKVAVDEKSKIKGGLTIFGENFGNYNQGILARALYTDLTD